MASSKYLARHSSKRVTSIPTASGEFSVQSLINCSSASSSIPSSKPRLRLHSSPSSGSFVRHSINRLSVFVGRNNSLGLSTTSSSSSLSTTDKDHPTGSSSAPDLPSVPTSTVQLRSASSPSIAGDRSFRTGNKSSSCNKMAPTNLLKEHENDADSLFSAKSVLDSADSKTAQLAQIQTQNCDLDSRISAPSIQHRRRRRDSSLSPTTHGASSESEIQTHVSSPASSMIFERSVQEFCPLFLDSDKNYTYHNEDYIPPVLDATTNAITDESVDPDMIDVSVPNPRLKSISSFSQLYRHSGVVSPHGPHATTPPHSPGSERKMSVQSTASSCSPNHVPKKVLSFYSFADLCTAEGLPVSPLSPEEPTSSSIGDELAPSTTVRTLSETLRHNTGEIQGH